MKSTKVQNPRRMRHIKPITLLLARPRGVAVLLLGQFSLLRGLAALVCLVWGKIEPATRPSGTIVACQSGSRARMAQAGSAGQCLHNIFSTHLDHLVVIHTQYNVYCVVL